MSKKLVKCIVAFVLGLVGLVATSIGIMAFVISPSGEFSLFRALFVAISIFLVLGLVSGVVGREKSLLWGICVATPLVLSTLLSVLFTGPTATTVSNDLPVLLASLIVAVTGGYVGGATTSENVGTLARH